MGEIEEGDIEFFIRDFYEPAKQELKESIEEHGPSKSTDLIGDSVKMAIDEWNEMNQSLEAQQCQK